MFSCRGIVAYYFVTNVPGDARVAHNVIGAMGLPAARQLRCGDFEVFYCGKRNRSLADQWLEHGERGFILAVGTFIYDGQAGTAALQRALDDLTAQRFTLERCRGHFNVLWGRPASGELTLLTDKAGLIKAYASTRGGSARYSSSFLTLASCLESPRLCAQACAELVSNSATVGSECVIEGIRKLPMQSRIELADGRTARLPVEDASVPASVSAATLAEQLVQDVAFLRALPYPLNADLSAGYDTRVIAALLKRLDVPHTYNVNGASAEDSQDIAIATAIARQEQREIVVFPTDDIMRATSDQTPLEERTRIIDESFLIYDGLRNPFSSSSSSILFGKKAQKIGFLVGGHGGELLRPYFDKLLVPVLPLRTFVAKKLVSPRLGGDTAAIVDRLVESVSDATGIGPLAYGADFYRLYYGVRMRNWAGDRLAMQNRYYHKYSPLNEWSVAQRHIGVARSHKLWERLIRELIAALDPAMARYPSQYGDLSGPLSARDRIGRLASFAKGQAHFARPQRRPEPKPGKPQWFERELPAVLELDARRGEVEEALRTPTAQLNATERAHALGLAYLLKRIEQLRAA